MDLKLKGRSALVTGGAIAVGREIALALAAEGAAVAVNYRSSAKDADALVAEIKGRGGKAIAIEADVADLESVKAMVARTIEEFATLDILVNNAGLALRRPFIDTTPEEWRRQIDVCLYGAIHCSHAAAPHLIKSGHGRIISIVGDSSRVGESGISIVAAARAGTIALMKSIARELGRSGVTANTLSLGMIETEHDKTFLEANREKLIKFYPTRRLGQPQDVAPMVALLASDHGSWITGQAISVSGGFSMV